jgi:hypothetical protein
MQTGIGATVSPAKSPMNQADVRDAAKFYNRSERTIRLWCKNGTLLLAGCRVVREMTGRWIIYLPSH